MAAVDKTLLEISLEQKLEIIRDVQDWVLVIHGFIYTSQMFSGRV